MSESLMVSDNEAQLLRTLRDLSDAMKRPKSEQRSVVVGDTKRRVDALVSIIMKHGPGDHGDIVEKHASEERRLRARMADMKPEWIEEAVVKLHADQHAELEILALRVPLPEFDDSGYRPGGDDHLLRGAGRATGQTAAAVKRGRTITKHQHTERGGS